MSTLAEIDAAENEQVRNRIDELLEERLALIERCN